MNHTPPHPARNGQRLAEPDHAGANGRHGTARAEIWPDPISLDSPKPPELPDGIFQCALGDMIDAVAEATEAPRELAVTFGLGALATVAQKRFSVMVKAGYFEPVNIWLATAMNPGNRKSDIEMKMIRPLALWERRQAAELLPLIEKAMSERKTIEQRVVQLRAVAAKANPADFVKLKAEIAEIEATLPEVPRLPQLYSQDVTNEHTGTMLAENGERLSLLSDEGGLFDLMGGRYSNGLPNLDLYLQSHSGSSVRVNRGSRPAINLEHPALTIALSPQPDVIRGLTSKREFRGRGLLARFAFMLPTSRLGYRTNDTTPVPDSVANSYRDCILALANVKPNNKDDHDVPHVLTLSDDARQLWDAFWQEIETMMRAGGRLEHLTDWGGKLPGLVARVAGLLHCADYAGSILTAKKIDAAWMVRAIDFGQFLIEHALIAFDLMGADDAKDAARDLWKSIEKLRKPTFTMREAWHPLRGKYHKVSDAEPGFDVLVDHGYVMEPHQADANESPRRRGRQPSRQFIVNPKLSEGWR